MTLRKHTVRLSADVDKALVQLANQRNITVYAMLPQCVEAGVAALAEATEERTGNRELIAEVASLGAHVADIERMIDRALFTACAAYCYARSAAMGGGKTDEILLGEINRAYARQKALATGRS
ncbi:MAG: hypothetical protein ACT6R2_00955 [Blastomonas fulva]|uniref:hypothetical protein n=1 Tax=Blastomonas fulva TaxID=1550728 RepID=UPI0040336239